MRRLFEYNGRNGGQSAMHTFHKEKWSDTMDIKEIVAILIELLEDQEGVEIAYTIESQEQDGKTAYIQ